MNTPKRMSDDRANGGEERTAANEDEHEADSCATIIPPMSVSQSNGICNRKIVNSVGTHNDGWDGIILTETEGMVSSVRDKPPRCYAHTEEGRALTTAVTFMNTDYEPSIFESSTTPIPASFNATIQIDTIDSVTENNKKVNWHHDRVRAVLVRWVL